MRVSASHSGGGGETHDSRQFGTPPRFRAVPMTALASSLVQDIVRLDKLRRFAPQRLLRRAARVSQHGAASTIEVRVGRQIVFALEGNPRRRRPAVHRALARMSKEEYRAALRCVSSWTTK